MFFVKVIVISVVCSCFCCMVSAIFATLYKHDLTHYEEEEEED